MHDAAGRKLGSTREQDKFVLGYIDCILGKQHLKQSTLNSIRGKKQKLSCVFCHGGELGSRWESELTFIDKVKALGKDEHFMFQVGAPWKVGMVDFVYMPPGQEPMEGWVYIEVDGCSHTKESWGKRVQQQVEADLQQCMAAVAAGARLLRLHHEDLHLVGNILAIAEQCSSSCFVALSPSFKKVKAFGKKQLLGVPLLLQEMLGGAAEMEECAGSGYWYYPRQPFAFVVGRAQ